MDSFNEYIEKIATTYVGASPVRGGQSYSISTDKNKIKRGKAIALDKRMDFARKRLFNVLKNRSTRGNVLTKIRRNIIQKRIRDYSALGKMKATNKRMRILGPRLRELRNTKAWKNINFARANKNPANIFNDIRRAKNPNYGSVNSTLSTIPSTLYGGMAGTLKGIGRAAEQGNPMSPYNIAKNTNEARATASKIRNTVSSMYGTGKSVFDFLRNKIAPKAPKAPVKKDPNIINPNKINIPKGLGANQLTQHLFPLPKPANVDYRKGLASIRAAKKGKPFGIRPNIIAGKLTAPSALSNPAKQLMSKMRPADVVRSVNGPLPMRKKVKILQPARKSPVISKSKSVPPRPTERYVMFEGKKYPRSKMVSVGGQLVPEALAPVGRYA